MHTLLATMNVSMQLAIVLFLGLICKLNSFAFRTQSISSFSTTKRSLLPSNNVFAADPTPEKSNWEKIKEELAKDNSNKKPPIYEPGPYPQRALAAAAYLIPLIDATDLGKYMFEAYPFIGTFFNGFIGPLSEVYNGIPFLPFAVYFIMSYISRAPSFPTEIRFHFAQAFMVGLVQLIPSILLGVMEKAGVPGLAVLYNTRK